MKRNCKYCKLDRDEKEFTNNHKSRCKYCSIIFNSLKEKIHLMNSDIKEKYFLELYYELEIDNRSFATLFSVSIDKIHDILIKYNIKRCSCCKQIKILDTDFSPEKEQNHKGFHILYHSRCLKCISDRVNKEHKKEYDYNHVRKPHIKIIRNIQQNQRLEEDISYKLRKYMGSAIWRMLKDYTGGKISKEGHSWLNLVDYSLQDLKNHLESKFQDGMSWDNYGDWHIDHKTPISTFNITSLKCSDFKDCWSLENLQPLWAEDNLKKGNRLN